MIVRLIVRVYLILIIFICPALCQKGQRIALDSLLVCNSKPYVLTKDSLIGDYGELGYEQLFVKSPNIVYFDTSRTLIFEGTITDISEDPLRESIILLCHLKDMKDGKKVIPHLRIEPEKNGHFYLKATIEQDDYIIISSFTYFARMYKVGKLIHNH